MLDQTTTSNKQSPASANTHDAQQPAAKPILIVLHQQQSTPAHVGMSLTKMGHRLDIRRPRFGDPLPETLEHHDGAVIFGGPQSANDTDDFIKTETDWIGVPLREQKPFLGICLGAQMFARFLGAKVSTDGQDRVGIGYHPVEPLVAAITGIEWPKTVYQWHREGFDLPAGADLLVRSDTAFENQAFRYGSGTAIQFHPEITYLQVCRWSGKSPGRLAEPCAQDRPTQLRGHITHAPAVQRWREAFLKHWVASGRAASA